ncbi:MAG: hypothetical protein K2I42_07550, partial [Anaeroplasmataceae bacterium]|nr:hypothetical protein [Anaeroplasmataceae bacterium]
IDRFGEENEELLLYMYEKLMKNYCKKLKFVKLARTNPRYYDFILDKDLSHQLDGNFLFQQMLKYKNLKLTYKNQEIHIVMEIQGRDKLSYFKEICSYFNDIDKK